MAKPVKKVAGKKPTAQKKVPEKKPQKETTKSQMKKGVNLPKKIVKRPAPASTASGAGTTSSRVGREQSERTKVTAPAKPTVKPKNEKRTVTEEKRAPVLPPKPSRDEEIVQSAKVEKVTIKQKKIIPKELPGKEEIHATPVPEIHTTTVPETQTTKEEEKQRKEDEPSEKNIPKEPDEEHIPVAKSKVHAIKLQAEALLFSSGKALEEELLMSTIGVDKRTLKKALLELKLEYEQRDNALKVFNEGTSWKLLVKDEHVSLVRKIVANTELTRATMETLAVIAYHQPDAMQSKVVDIRGGNAYEHIAELEGLGFVTKAKRGRSFILKLTEKFFEYFDVDGATSIKKIFNEVKPPDGKQQKLGDLEVIDEPPEAPKGPNVNGLEVVEGLAPAEKGEPVEERPQFEPAKLEVDKEEQNDFLKKLEAQIDELTKRNDGWNDDQDLKARTTEPSAQPAGEEASKDEENDDAEEEKKKE